LKTKNALIMAAERGSSSPRDLFLFGGMLMEESGLVGLIQVTAC
jgi:hypothetical protein